jgi:glycosyltransferase A (GT-A) superfamily protein (DUF2064 family)
MNIHLLVIAKAPEPGRVKTRLCPPCTPEQAAVIAAGALADTLTCVEQTPASRRTIVLCGRYTVPPGWSVVDQRGAGLAMRLAHAFADTALPGTASLLVGMDTPQITPTLLESVSAGLSDADAVLGPAIDGGWWTLALRDPHHAEALRDVPMSTSDTADRTVAALRRRRLRVRYAAVLRDVDTADDARHVAAGCRPGAFTAAVRTHIPAVVGR